MSAVILVKQVTGSSPGMVVYRIVPSQAPEMLILTGIGLVRPLSILLGYTIYISDHTFLPLIFFNTSDYTNIMQNLRKQPGPRLNIKIAFPGMGILMLKIRRSRDRLIFNMGILILVSRHLCIETAPWTSEVYILFVLFESFRSLWFWHLRTY